MRRIDRPGRKKVDAQADAFFEECVDALKDAQSLSSASGERSDSNTGALEEFYDEIFSEMQDSAIEELINKKDTLDTNQKKLFDHVLKHRRETRVEQDYEYICALVKKLPVISITKNHYMKIIRDRHLPAHTKVDKMIVIAQSIIEKRDSKKQGFLDKHFYSKENVIHRAIASIHQNEEETLVSNESAPTPAE